MSDDDIRIGPQGRVEGIDGMVDQVTSSAVRAVRVELWPTIARSDVPERMGRAQGEAIGRKLRPWVGVGAVAALVAAVAAVCAEARHRREARERGELGSR